MNDRDKLKIFKPEHGEEVIWDLKNKSTVEKLKRITMLQNEVTLYLYAVCGTLKDYKYHIPCKQCVKDTALQFEEIGSLLRELVDDK